ncbi:MAG: glutamate--tRNA ligase family protein, partial [archaeon]|nr:glutamate--tRNA ligase family protein [archaeon]
DRAMAKKEAPLIVLYPKEVGLPRLLQLISQVSEVPQLKSVAFKPAGKFQSRVELKLVAHGGHSLYGTATIARYFARLDPSLYGNGDPVAASSIDEWLDEASTLGAPTATADQMAWLCLEAEAHLRTRTFLVGHAFSLADFAVWLSLDAFLAQNPSFDLATSLPHLARWFNFLASFPAFVDLRTPVVAHSASTSSPSSASSSSSSSAGRGDATVRTKCLELDGAEMGKVVTRFPPEPSGFMHLGHCKASFFNYLTAERYQGKMILRFDDTNPATATQQFEDSFIRDLALLQINYVKVTHTSENFPLLLEWCEKLLQSGDLYVDSSTDEEIKAQRGDRQPSPFRDSPPEENLARWQKMVAGDDVKSVVRAKIDHAHDVGCLRDPNMFRSANEPHYKTGTKYKVYPLYDFACPIIDSVEGITHAFRSNEYHDRDALYRWVQEKTGVRPVRISDFGRLSFSYTLMSKRKLAWFVKQGIVDDWNHPAFPTVQGLFRRGITLDALREFVVRQGATSNAVLIDSNDLWSLNRIRIDPVVPRYFAINHALHYLVTLSNYVSPVSGSGHEGKTVPLYRKDPSLGSKVITLHGALHIEAADGKRLQPGGKITLMGWGNARVSHVDHEARAVTARLDLDDTDFSSSAKLSWVPAIPDVVTADLVDYKPLITKPCLSSGDPRKNKPADQLEDFANRDLAISETVFAEGSIRSLARGSRVQFERRGYYILDKLPSETPDHRPLFVKIPEGRIKSMSSNE